MRIPYLNKDRRETKVQDTFLGYDRSRDAEEKGLYDSLNMSADEYPLLSVRKPRAQVNTEGAQVYEIMSLDAYSGSEIRKNALVADTEGRLKVYYPENGVMTGHDLANTVGTLTSGQKTVALAGTKIYFFPDKVYYDLVNRGESGWLEYSTEMPLGLYDGAFIEIGLECCDIFGSDSSEASPYRRLRRSAYTATDEGGKGTFKKYMPFSASLAEGDTVNITGFQRAELNGYYNIKTVGQDRSFIVIESPETCLQDTGCIYIKREVPEMDFVVSAKNRLWGCRYGMDKSGRCVNEIYASAAGDAKNWHRFQGVSTDSWAAEVGAAGAFTGAFCIDGCPVFFKEDAVIKVHGSYPSEFTVTESAIRGIEAGSERSAVIVGDELYYKTYSGIVRYDGGYPVNVDRALGGERYKNAVAGSDGEKYYISMENEKGERCLFVYDTKKRIWHREDDPGILSFCRCGRELYFLSRDKEGNTSVWCTSPMVGLEPEKGISWFCESARLGYEAQGQKHVSSVQIRADVGAAASMSVALEYDGGGKWQNIRTLRGKGRNALLRFAPRRCDSFRIRLSGKGEARVRSVARTYEEGSAFEPLQ